MSNIKEPMPKVPMFLGLAGLIPFILLGVMLWALPIAQSAATLRALLAYAAIILTFVGALHWGVALAHPEMTERERSTLMTWSAVPALIAWGVFFVEPLIALIVLTATFSIQLIADQHLVRRFNVSPWFLHLRQRLTAAVVVCLGLALLSVISV